MQVRVTNHLLSSSLILIMVLSIYFMKISFSIPLVRNWHRWDGKMNECKR